jgi:hypothetical protein
MTIFNDLSRCKALADPRPISLSATGVSRMFRLCAHGQAGAHIEPTVLNGAADSSRLNIQHHLVCDVFRAENSFRF